MAKKTRLSIIKGVKKPKFIPKSPPLDLMIRLMSFSYREQAFPRFSPKRRGKKQ